MAHILDVIDKSGVAHQLTPMGTILDGERDQMTGVVSTCFRELERDCNRIGVNLKVDYRKGPAPPLPMRWSPPAGGAAYTSTGSTLRACRRC